MKNTLRVLVATDCHLGYLEKDEIRRHDSFKAFEEICSIAEQKQVVLYSCVLFSLDACSLCLYIYCGLVVQPLCPW